MIAMGKRKNAIRKAAPATLRHHDLKGELGRYGVRKIYDLPLGVLIEHRGLRLMEVM